jgi:hypothetical protein
MAKIKGVYDGLTVEVMTYAFAEACKLLPKVLTSPDRDLIAKRILGTAALGERDPMKMRDDAVAFLIGA